MQIQIPIHSFVDLITNSSSETFVGASESSVETVRQLIDGILLRSGSKKTCADILTLEYVAGDGYDTTSKIVARAVDPLDSDLAALVNQLNDVFVTEEVMC